MSTFPKRLLMPRVDGQFCHSCQQREADGLCICMSIYTEPCGVCLFRQMGDPASRCSCVFLAQEASVPQPGQRGTIQGTIEFARRHAGNWRTDWLPQIRPQPNCSCSNPADVRRWVELYKNFLHARGGQLMVFMDNPVTALRDVPDKQFMYCINQAITRFFFFQNKFF